MATTDYRAIIESGDFHPYVIKTKGGRHYVIGHRANAFISEAYPETVIVCDRGQGVSFVGLDSIEAIQFDHEEAASGR